MTTLGEDLPKEQARVRELILIYRDPGLNGAGEFAARMMEQSLRFADEAIIAGDMVQMLKAYKELKEWE